MAKTVSVIMLALAIHIRWLFIACETHQEEPIRRDGSPEAENVKKNMGATFQTTAPPSETMKARVENMGEALQQASSVLMGH